MTTQSTTDLPGESGPSASDHKIYLAQTGSGFDYDAEIKHAQEALEATKQAYMEATENCSDAEAARAAAEKAEEAARVVSAIEEEARKRMDDGALTHEQYREFDLLEKNARAVANYAAAVGDAAYFQKYYPDEMEKTGRAVCASGIPMSRTEPTSPAGATADMRSPLHPDYALFENVYAGIVRIDQERGYTTDQSSERLAAALTVQSKSDGLDAVRHVAMNQEGTRAFAIDTQDPASPSANRSSVDVTLAKQQSVEASNEKLAQANLAIAIQSQDSPAARLDESARGNSRTV